MIAHKTELESLGITVTSRWLEPIPVDRLEDARLTEEAQNSLPDCASFFASRDFEDVARASTLVQFSESPSGTFRRGGTSRGVRDSVGVGAKNHRLWPERNRISYVAIRGAVRRLECGGSGIGGE